MYIAAVQYHVYEAPAALLVSRTISHPTIKFSRTSLLLNAAISKPLLEAHNPFLKIIR
jgi:hypothetical protein